jgi:hypothetical protein
VRQENPLRPLFQRLTNRWNGALALIVGGSFCSLLLLDGHRPPGLGEWLLPFLLVYLHLTLTPLPWQWAGGGKTERMMLRGLLGALAFNALWIGVLLLMAHIGRPPDFAHPPPGWPPGIAPPPLRGRHLNPGWGLGLINLAIALLVGWVLAEKEAMAARELETAALLRQAEAKALQNQLEPHVLYNALSSLSELIYEDPLAAESVITQLADLYRQLTHHGKRDQVSLGEERQLVESYLAMEQMRLGERLKIAWQWPDWADALRIPPFFLQPLVENAIKHGIGPSDVGGEVRISCVQAGGRTLLRVENTGVQPVAESETGIGLGNLRARLALWTGAGSFSLVREGAWTVAVLSWKPGGGA